MRFILALVFVAGCLSGCNMPIPKLTTKADTAGGAKIRADVRQDAFAIMMALSAKSVKENKGKLLPFDTESPPAWWTEDPASKKLTPGVRYKLASGVEGALIPELHPLKPLFTASGKPITEAFAKAEIVITAGLLPDPSRHIPPPATPKKSDDKW